MGVISKNERKLTLYYHSEKSIDRQTYAYANASKKELHAVDISKTNITGTQWSELATKLGKSISDLINKDNSDFLKKFGDDVKKMAEHDWLKVLENEPKYLKYPIAVYGEDYIEIKTAAHFKEYMEPDTAGLKKLQLNEQFTDRDEL